MIGVLFYVLIGLALGWNFPQPTYAKVLQEMVKAKWAAFRNRPSK